MQILDHERLDVYKLARELTREVHRLMKKSRFRREDAPIVDQVNRSTASIPLNIAEGSGEGSPGRKAYFYRIARGSATELSAALDHMVDKDMLNEEDTATAKGLIVRIVSMLFKLTRSVNTPDSFPPLPKRQRTRTRAARHAT
jgi:four helix bundle protein